MSFVHLATESMLIFMSHETAHEQKSLQYKPTQLITLTSSDVARRLPLELALIEEAQLVPKRNEFHGCLSTIFHTFYCTGTMIHT